MPADKTKPTAKTPTPATPPPPAAMPTAEQLRWYRKGIIDALTGDDEGTPESGALAGDPDPDPAPVGGGNDQKTPPKP